MRKVFCIGFQKTGTSSLAKALGILGYSVGGYYDFRHLAKKENLTEAELIKAAIETAKRYDAVQDTPYPPYFRELDKAFPGSKFILVTRDPEQWLKSAVTDFANYENQIHQVIYGVPYPIGHEDAFVERFSRHNREVVEYFADRPDDLLVMDLSKVGWEPVCQFLGKPVPDVPWPVANTKKEKNRKKLLWRVMRKLGLRE